MAKYDYISVVSKGNYSQRHFRALAFPKGGLMLEIAIATLVIGIAQLMVMIFRK
ncbi:hypothetical protein [Marinomonas sp. BSi20584]|uniref:hypothetical protein n=1 Tax=Marinomonas sp. BSi20584 TaxID=1594462 RepID=UPI0012FE538B|nr:hypothetical protein [Marinomonas sp. BSi20584]